MLMDGDLPMALREAGNRDWPRHAPWGQILDQPMGHVDGRSSLLLIAGTDQHADLAAIAKGLDIRLAGAVPLEEAGTRLRRTVAVDMLMLDLRGLEAGDRRLEDRLRGVLAWPGLGDARLLVVMDLAALDPVVALLGEVPATLLCAPRPADIVLALHDGARDRHDSARLHDVGRESETGRLDQLSEEVRRLAQTIDRLAQGGRREEEGRLHEAQHSYTLPPASFGAAPVRRSVARGGTAGPISRDDVRALLQARRLRDRYLPADLFADPAWDMILDLMAARLTGKRVSVSSLCIAAAVPPTTALRWIGQLTERGIFVRTNDPADARRVFITLSDEAAESVAAWFAATRRAGLGLGG